jgi:hypothetical protein
MGKVQPDPKGDGPWGAVVPGGIFALAGYCITFWDLHGVQIDLQRRRWLEQKAGIRPFVPRTAGALETWEQVRFAREQRTYEEEDIQTTWAWDAWSVSLIARGGHRAPLTLPGFDFPCETVSRADALALAQQLAHRVNLPLQQADQSTDVHIER